jgi:hypothetical protein
VREHCYDTHEHFFAGPNTVGQDELLGDRCIQASGTFECRTTGVIEEFGAMASVTFAVSLSRVEKHGKARAIQLFDQLPPVLDRRSTDITYKVADPSHELEFDTVDVEFFVIKNGFHWVVVTQLI